MSSRRTLVARSVTFILVAVAFAFTGTLTLAQPRGKAGHAHAPPKKPKADAGPPPSDSDTADAGSEPMNAKPENAPRGGAQDGGMSSGSGQLGGTVLEQKTLDGGAKVFRFGEIEIEGRLKSPQLVYFLRRVRAEFAAGDLGHRTFMRELSDTRREPSF
jgi:hypothetical protein